MARYKLHMTNSKIYGIAKLNNHLLCCDEVLNQSYDIKIANHKGKILLPLKPINNEDRTIPLLPPSPAKKWKNVGTGVYAWGELKSETKSFGVVKRVLFEFNSDIHNYNEYCNDIYSAFSEWTKLFEQYVQLFTKQKTINHIKITGNTPWQIDLYVNDCDKLRPKNNNSQVINIITGYGDNSLSREQFSKICRYASNGLKPKLEYLLLLESYNSMKNDDYRNVIIECTSALEICIVNRLLVEFNKLQLSFGEDLLKKYSGLGRKFELLKLLKIDCPDINYKGNILKPRNDVVHKAVFPSLEQANNALIHVEKIIKYFSPKYY